MTGCYPVLLISLVAYVSAGCPTGALYNADSKMCYQYSNTAMSFIGAESVCKEINGHLASIQNAFINMEVQTQANTFFSCSGHSDYWLGGNTVLSPSWNWMDETTWSYTNWANGQGGTSSNSQCLSANISDGKWYSSSCDVTKAFVCAIPETTPTCPISPTPMPAPSCPSPVARCDDEWIHFNDTGFCYNVQHNMDYWSAENHCISMGSHLTSIHSFVENNFALKISRSGAPIPSGYGYVWIGLNLQNGEWAWTDGTPFDYQIWQPGNPENGAVSARMLSDTNQYVNQADVGLWDATSSQTIVMRAFVCKKKAYW